MHVYMQIAIYWLDPPNTDKKANMLFACRYCLQICEIGGC